MYVTQFPSQLLSPSPACESSVKKKKITFINKKVLNYHWCTLNIRSHENMCRPETVERSSQTTSERSVPKAQRSSATWSQKASWETCRCLSSLPGWASTACPPTSNTQQNDSTVDSQTVRLRSCVYFIFSDIPDQCWACPEPPAGRGRMHHVRSTICAAPAGKLCATCCCLLPAAKQAHPRWGCSSQPTWQNRTFAMCGATVFCLCRHKHKSYTSS